MDDMIHVITMIHGDTCDHRVYQVHGDIHHAPDMPGCGLAVKKQNIFQRGYEKVTISTNIHCISKKSSPLGLS